MGVHSTVFVPIKYGSLPQLLHEDELVAGNAMIEGGTFIAILLGTIGGGLLITLPTVGPTYVTITLIVVAVIGLACSFSIPTLPPVDPGLRVARNPFTPTIEVIKTSAKNRSVFLSILGISWFWFFGSAMLSLFPPYALTILAADEHVVTLFLATFSVGIAVGSFFCEKLSRERLELGLVPLGSLGMTVLLATLFLLPAPRSAATRSWALPRSSSRARAFSSR